MNLCEAVESLFECARSGCVSLANFPNEALISSNELLSETPKRPYAFSPPNSVLLLNH